MWKAPLDRHDCRVKDIAMYFVISTAINNTTMRQRKMLKSILLTFVDKKGHQSLIEEYISF